VSSGYNKGKHESIRLHTLRRFDGAGEHCNCTPGEFAGTAFGTFRQQATTAKACACTGCGGFGSTGCATTGKYAAYSIASESGAIKRSNTAEGGSED
jgi:hypothetical protein